MEVVFVLKASSEGKEAFSDVSNRDICVITATGKKRREYWDSDDQNQHNTTVRKKETSRSMLPKPLFQC